MEAAVDARRSGSAETDSSRFSREQAGLGGWESWSSLGNTTLHFSVQKENSSRGSQPQRPALAKETLSLGGTFYFYLLSQHRV